LRTLSSEKIFGAPLSPRSEAGSSAGSSGGILEQAWLNKIARDIARKVDEERRRSSEEEERRKEHEGGRMSAPPAYVV
jgi:distribution and morphology protein 34